MFFSKGNQRNKERSGTVAADAVEVVTPRERADVIASQAEDLKQEIAELERFLLDAPKNERTRLIESIDTLPPPDDLHGKVMMPGFGVHADRPTRAQIDAFHRIRRQHMVLFVVLVCGLIAFLGWVVTFLGRVGA